MSSTSKRPHGAVIGVGLLGMLLGTPVAFAADTGITSRDIGVVPATFVVVDMPFSARKARVIFSARDAAISNGRAADVEQIRARLCVEYGDKATGGSFVIPAGTANGWRSNDSTLTRYRNRDAPNGATQTRSIVVQPGRLVRVKGAGRGDMPLNIVGAGPPTGGIYVSFEMVEAGITTRLCSEVQNCEYHAFEGGAGATLRCVGGIADPLCRGAHPVYVANEDARYGGAGTVAVIGDSITVQATGALKTALVGQWFIHVRAKSGSMFRHLQPAAEKIGESNPQVVVINLGTNDFGCILLNVFTPDNPCAFPDFTLSDLLDDGRAMVASVVGACVIGTTTWFGDAIGELWADMVATGELAGVVPWREYLLSLSADERELFLLDGIGHLTPAGTAALAEMTAQVIEQSCGTA